jgi:hypothetical protein
MFKEILIDHKEIIVALIAVAGIALTAWIALKNNNKNCLIKTVTDERAKWRDEIRKVCSEFVKLVFEQVTNTNKTNTARIHQLKTHMQLRLNPSENSKHKPDQDIIEVVSNIVNSLDQPNCNEAILRKLGELQLKVQKLLKSEWEKSKEEAKTGKLGKQIIPVDIAMTGITFKTPFVSFVGILVLALLSLHNYSSALAGFVSEPLFWASGFACVELSFLLLIMKFTGNQRAGLINLFGEILTFCYGVFVCVVLALCLQDASLFTGAISTIVIITLLMLLIDFVYSKRFDAINNLLATPVDNTLNKVAVLALKVSACIFLISYIIFVFLSKFTLDAWVRSCFVS